MEQSAPDFTARIRLNYKEEGRFNSGLRAERVSLSLFYRGEYFDCLLLLDQLGIGLELGVYATVPIKLMHPQYLKGLHKPGQRFKLWRGKFVGDGEVVQVMNQTDSSLRSERQRDQAS